MYVLVLIISLAVSMLPLCSAAACGFLSVSRFLAVLVGNPAKTGEIEGVRAGDRPGPLQNLEKWCGSSRRRVSPAGRRGAEPREGR